MKRIITILLPLLVLTSCEVQPDNGDQIPEKPQYNPEFDTYAKVSISSQITDVQPMTGIVPWSDSHYKKDWVTLGHAGVLLYAVQRRLQTEGRL